MKLFEVSIRFTAKKTDANYIIRHYAVMALTKIDAYQKIMNKHLDERHLIIDIQTEEKLEGWISLYPDIDSELEGDYAANSEVIKQWEKGRQDPTWFYLIFLVLIVYIAVALIIINATR